VESLGLLRGEGVEALSSGEGDFCQARVCEFGGGGPWGAC
jgi:hypothetical protein